MPTAPDDSPLIDRLLSGFAPLGGLETEARRLLDRSVRQVTLPAGAVVFRDGDSCQAYTLVLDGCVRVQKVSESGRQIVLYRVEPGQTCVLTTNALMTELPYAAEGVTESEVRAAVLPSGVFQAMLDTSTVFRRFVFSAYAARISDLLLLIDEVAFGRIDARLAHLLLTRADNGGIVLATHLDLAMELGSAREVISRQLKDFERRNWVIATRGQVRVTDAAALGRLRGRDQGSDGRDGGGVRMGDTP
ncbi:Crp/Fnr family transcriptional regulator [Rhodospira trueperi]|uniref:CRP/FNR family transcriptional regulator, anaerobic regulatory protein n=1 Tax=Rhodospira trueperi TaxID=69960 RepID=A0A1G7A3X1_9PROT|nr:Crp/Fnr family transcriptional regulator [Rhodospira trueperi]SDE09470.1 CRP/FNR family transcriptional regulator, anaerobic regulatory protein [Rhodospira trueperi]